MPRINASIDEQSVSIGQKKKIGERRGPDLVGIALPAGSYSVQDGEARKSELPSGITLLAKAGMEDKLIRLTKDLEGVFQDIDDEE